MGRFFLPTEEFKKYKLLELISKNDKLTQLEMANTIGIAPSMVNKYLKEIKELGFIVINEISRKVKFYNITKEGLNKKEYFEITYINELIQQINNASESINRIFKKIEDRGLKNIVLYGAGETGQVISSIYAKENIFSFIIHAVIDDALGGTKKNIFSIPIIKIEDLKKYRYDMIIITSYGYAQGIYKQIEKFDKTLLSKTCDFFRF